MPNVKKSFIIGVPMVSFPCRIDENKTEKNENSGEAENADNTNNAENSENTANST